MATIKDRLRLARKRAGFTSARSAAIAHGWGTSTYGGHEGSGNDLTTEAAAKYAVAFNCSLDWLVTGKGNAERPRLSTTFPLLGEILAGGVVNEGPVDGSGNPIKEIAVFGMADAIRTGAYRLPGPDRHTHYPPNTVIVVGERTCAIHDLIDQEVVCCCDDRRVRFGVLRFSEKLGTYELEAEPGTVTIVRHVNWAAPVRHAVFP